MAEEAQVQAVEQVAAVESQPAVQAPVVEAPKKVSRFGEKKVVEIKQEDGSVEKFTLQYPGIRVVLDIYDNAQMANGNLSRTAFADQAFAEVVVDPVKLDLDYFDEHDGFNELLDQIAEFLA
ncbi:hypothetical protein [Weissella cibaria]|uniref:hypothetical protein n=1 Tax=Weissella cibaria TaxID=137591 RepID=UPI000ED34CD4|nr:hypothetical protein [Weissella cibaria]HCU09079.1 hypothetical protein [Weissella cibaria]